MGSRIMNSLGVLLILCACRGREAPPAATSADHSAPQVHLAEYGGKVFDLKEQRGNVVLLFFGYTHCPDICATTLADFAGVRHRLGPRADQVKFVFISIDPRRDTPQATQQYARGFDHSFIGLSGDSTAIAKIERDFHVASYAEKDSAGQYTVAHSGSVFVIGKDGGLTETLPFSGPAEETLFELTDTALRAEGQ
jgi:protein SCO1/2